MPCLEKRHISVRAATLELRGDAHGVIARVGLFGLGNGLGEAALGLEYCGGLILRVREILFLRDGSALAILPVLSFTVYTAFSNRAGP
jgi:hypothetical protein